MYVGLLPRAYVSPRYSHVVPVVRIEGLSFTLSNAPPLLLARNASGTVQPRTGTICRCCYFLDKCTVLLGYSRGASSSNFTSIERVLGTQPMLLEASHKWRKIGSHEERKNNDLRDVHPFVNSNELRTAAHPCAALPRCNVQSPVQRPTT